MDLNRLFDSEKAAKANEDATREAERRQAAADKVVKEQNRNIEETERLRNLEKLLKSQARAVLRKGGVRLKFCHPRRHLRSVMTSLREIATDEYLFINDEHAKEYPNKIFNYFAQEWPELYMLKGDAWLGIDFVLANENRKAGFRLVEFYSDYVTDGAFEKGIKRRRENVLGETETEAAEELVKKLARDEVTFVSSSNLVGYSPFATAGSKTWLGWLFGG